jgi:hypothetical protein
MTVSTGIPIQTALVQTLRSSDGPKSFVFPVGVPGGDQLDYAKVPRDGQHLTGKWLHEGFAPEKATYPLVTYQHIYGPRFYTWGSVMLRTAYDVRAFSPNSVEADNLFALCAAVLDEAELSVAGQSTLICRRVADLRSPDEDEEGKKIYMVGGTYEIWTDQLIPQLMAGSFTAGAVII